MKTTIKEIKVIPLDYFVEQGRLGGLKTLKKYGKKYLKEQGKKGGRPRKALDKPTP